MADVVTRGFASLASDLSLRNFRDKASDAMNLTQDAGVAEMKRAVETRGTDRQWKNSWYSSTQGWRDHSGRGRVDSGNMLNTVAKGAIRSFGDTVSSTFGWAEGSDDYIRFQEYGFNHVLSGEFIDGVDAMIAGADSAADVAVDALIDAIDKMLKGK